jgi:4-aminobutyrate aminotransferase
MSSKVPSLNTRGKAVLSNVLGRYFQLEIVKGKGSYLFDINNRKYLDFASGIAVVSTGHCHPEVVKAINKQVKTLIHACIGIGFYNPPIELAEKIIKLTANQLNSVFFSQSGSEAIETALKLAKYVTKKPALVAFKGAFHGRSIGALSLTTSKEKYRNGYNPLLEHIHYFPYPNCYRCPWQKERTTCQTKCGHEIEKYLAGKKDIAAIIIEPIKGEGGYIPAPKAFLNILRQICNKNNILLIFDEVQTGFGRTGQWFAYQHYGIVPDIMALAKGIASGMPLGACLAKKEIMDQWTSGAHGGTYGSNPVTCAAGLATLKVLQKHLPQVSLLGQKAYALLKSKISQHKYVGDIRGQGLMIGIEFVKDKTSKEPHAQLVKKIMQDCLKEGLIVISCGMNDNVIRIIPPLTIKETELRKGLNILIKVINACH